MEAFYSKLKAAGFDILTISNDKHGKSMNMDPSKADHID